MYAVEIFKHFQIANETCALIGTSLFFSVLAFAFLQLRPEEIISHLGVQALNYGEDCFYVIPINGRAKGTLLFEKHEKHDAMQAAMLSRVPQESGSSVHA